MKRFYFLLQRSQNWILRLLIWILVALLILSAAALFYFEQQFLDILEKK